ncbi:MAG: lysoplasmalogenase [Clostridia bacterium]|nr:lysoplasmalogenase [Clostridia bacterium]
MQYACLACFVAATAFHLYASLRQEKRKRNVSKPFIILALLGFYALAAREVSLFIVLALALSWLGDVLLIPKGVKWFTAGGIAFMAGHVFFILGYLKDVDFTKIPLAVIILLAAVFIGAVTFLFSRLKPHLPKPLFYPMFLYLLINGAMNCFAIFRCISIGGFAGIITAVGAALFFISDSSLFFVRFDKNSPLKTHFVVMLTYSIGELLIILGLL